LDETIKAPVYKGLKWEDRVFCRRKAYWTVGCKDGRSSAGEKLWGLFQEILDMWFKLARLNLSGVFAKSLNIMQ